MFGIGWSEFLVIAVVAIIVIGPKDLPKVMRSFGKATAKMRSTAAHFRQQFDEAMKEADLDDVKSVIDDVRNLDPRRSLTQVLDPLRDAARDVKQSLSQTSDALKGLEVPSAEDRAILKSSLAAFPPANDHDDNLIIKNDDGVFIDEDLQVPNGQNTYDYCDFDARQIKGKSVKRRASYEMKRPLRQHRLKHNSGCFSRNPYGKKAALYFERSLKANISEKITKNSFNEAQGCDDESF